jgi:hypothetical protein
MTTIKPDGATGATNYAKKLTQQTEMAPPCHQPQDSMASIDIHNSDMETATVIKETNTLPNLMKD